MTRFSPSELDAIKAANPVDVVAGQWVLLRRKGQKWIGPCPLHSKNPQAPDSTSFECDSASWVCAVCEDGGDVFRLIALRDGLDPVRDFARLVEQLDPDAARKREAIDPEKAKAAEEARQRAAAEAEREQNIWREKARGRAWDMWSYGKPFAGSLAERYLTLRLGGSYAPGIRLRFDPAARYYVEDRPQWRRVHTGPAMLAAIQRGGKFLGLHRTFIDCGNTGGKFKAAIADPTTGLALNAKTMHGGKRGGHIALYGAAAPRVLYLGEGIEKVAAVWSALHEARRDLSEAAAWVAGDLGNLAGKAADRLVHPALKTESGRARRVPGVVPDATAPAIEIPDSVERLVLIGDSTSDRFTTECVIARAARRYARDGRAIVCAWSPAGKDFDDVLREAA